MKTNRTVFIRILALLCLVPLAAKAQFAFITNADNTLTITGYSGTNSVAVIPDFTNGCWVTAIGDNAFLYQSSLTSVTIPDSVTSIGTNVFA